MAENEHIQSEFYEPLGSFDSVRPADINEIITTANDDRATI